MITLSFSPCPNDIFALCALMQGHIPASCNWKIVLHDIETLNENAIKANSLRESATISKVSSGCLHALHGHYQLSCGMAHTEHAGPVLVTTQAAKNKSLKALTMLSPGEHTTAFALACHLLEIGPSISHTRYDKIIPMLLEGVAESGILIHEARFTYASYGLEKAFDLGQLWQQKHSSPLILATVVAHQSLSPDLIKAFIEDFRASLDWSWKHPEEALNFATQYAQEKEASIVKAHVQHFVSRYTYKASKDCLESLRQLGSHALPFDF
jgi:1,4-dihydroxy-6-naphthoate synthase